MSSKLWSWAMTPLLSIVLPSHALARQVDSTSLKVRVAIVMEDLEVRPVPLHVLNLLNARDSALVLTIRTNLSGLVDGRVPAGAYILTSAEPVTVHGVSYRWAIPIELDAGTENAIELSNANALTENTIAADAPPNSRIVDDAVTAFRRVRASVFRIEAGLSHGSGFLVDSAAGLVVTNAHVVQGSGTVHILRDSVSRILGKVVARNNETDVAVIWVNKEVIAGLVPLSVSSAQEGRGSLTVGELVFAVGFPLNQEQTFTTGVVSSIRDGAIMSDVNINPGNSGGPMLDYSGRVVGVNTFVDQDQRAGPGMGGAVSVDMIFPVLDQARLAIDSLGVPPATIFGTLPSDSYPIDALQAQGDTVKSKRLKEYREIGSGNFLISLETPVSLYVRMNIIDDELGRRRREREDRAGIAFEERYSGSVEMRNWYRYVSDYLTPVVALTVNPKIGETGGSQWLSVLGALSNTQTRATYEYKGDVRDVRLFRNGLAVEALRGGHSPVEVYEEDTWVSLKDVADIGYYVLSPEVFAPDTAGTPPSIVVWIEDLKKPDEPRCKEIPKKTAAYVWNDFAAYFATANRQWRFVAADPSANPRDFTVSSVGRDSLVTTNPKRDRNAVFPGCKF